MWDGLFEGFTPMFIGFGTVVRLPQQIDKVSKESNPKAAWQY